MELLKLNHAHTDLQSSTTEDMNVSAEAMKWDFSHFGRFSERYRDLYDNFPSETLSHSVQIPGTLSKLRYNSSKLLLDNR